MAKIQFAEQELRELHDLAKQWGKIVCRRAFGEQGPGLDVDLTTMENVAVEAMRGLVAGTLEAATAQQTQQLGSLAPCPACQQPCVVGSEPREIIIRGGGTFLYNEPVCHCTRCRRDFFPSASCSAAARMEL